eukprot:TRINITY_DN106496_c0_g1_i1.p1 TRINITY_DN106496_c0_g1~~TRINITY_DN106496_c0_g1_i1.p1  ORF type:complete len:493 (-),score=66.10 TRINITY_DN106496_c0_g1_i1:263-1741(-)
MLAHTCSGIVVGSGCWAMCLSICCISLFATALGFGSDLDLVDSFLTLQPRQDLEGTDGLIRTFGPPLCGGEDPCDLPPSCPAGKEELCRYDVYDSAVAAIYFVKRGRAELALPILDTFTKLLYPTGPVPLGRLYTDLPSNRTLTLLAASLRSHGHGSESIAEQHVDTGNNAWVGMAFAHYASATGSACHALVAHDILEALRRSTSCNDALRGFMGRPQSSGFYRSSEHAIDMYALARMLGETEVQQSARAFVKGMWGQNSNPGCSQTYHSSTSGAKRCDPSPRLDNTAVAADVQIWGILAQVDLDPARVHGLLEFSFSPDGLWTQDEDLAYPNEDPLLGVRFSSFGNGAQWEISAGFAMALKESGTVMSQFLSNQTASQSAVVKMLEDRRQQVLSSLRILLRRYRCIPGSVLGGNFSAWKQNRQCAKHGTCGRHPGGSDTGLGWAYFRYPHVASTAWAGLLFLQEAGAPNVNPFATPANQMPIYSAAMGTRC